VTATNLMSRNRSNKSWYFDTRVYIKYYAQAHTRTKARWHRLNDAHSKLRQLHVRRKYKRWDTHPALNLHTGSIIETATKRPWSY
jgi:hypothetical protein